MFWRYILFDRSQVIMDKHDHLPFKVGQFAEARSFLQGFRGAWFRCKVSMLCSLTFDILWVFVLKLYVILSYYQCRSLKSMSKLYVHVTKFFWFTKLGPNEDEARSMILFFIFYFYFLFFFYLLFLSCIVSRVLH